MYHNSGMCNVVVDLTWVPYLYLKNIVARGLSISRILNKWPPTGVMQQSHANGMMGPIFQSVFLWCCPNE